LGFRVFVDELMDTVPEVRDLKKQAIAQIHHRQYEDRLYNAVSLLARVCDNVSFAVLPGKKKTYYLGLANILKKPEFIDSAHAYTVIKILEDAHHFVDLLDKLHIDDKVRVFIGRENIIPEIKSCSMIATKYHIDGYGSGVLGILGPMRMNYAYNIGALEYVRDSL
jgi:heat-inducible transcriptional repressor